MICSLINSRHRRVAAITTSLHVGSTERIIVAAAAAFPRTARELYDSEYADHLITITTLHRPQRHQRVPPLHSTPYPVRATHRHNHLIAIRRVLVICSVIGEEKNHIVYHFSTRHTPDTLQSTLQQYISVLGHVDATPT